MEHMHFLGQIGYDEFQADYCVLMKVGMVENCMLVKLFLYC